MSEPRFRELLYQVGRGLHMWSLVEMDLARFFAQAAGLQHANPHALFCAIINFDTRLTLCDRAMDGADLDPVEREIWNKLSANLSKLYKKRHELAHFTLGRVGEADVIQPFLTTATLNSTKRKHLDSTQIKLRVRKFMELNGALDWFSQLVVRKRMPQQAPYLPPLEEPPLVTRLRGLAIQSLEEREQRGSNQLG